MFFLFIRTSVHLFFFKKKKNFSEIDQSHPVVLRLHLLYSILLSRMNQFTNYWYYNPTPFQPYSLCLTCTHTSLRTHSRRVFYLFKILPPFFLYRNNERFLGKKIQFPATFTHSLCTALENAATHAGFFTSLNYRIKWVQQQRPLPRTDLWQVLRYWFNYKI